MDWLRRLLTDLQEVWNSSNFQTRAILVASGLLIVFTLVGLVLVQSVISEPALSPAMTNLQPGETASIVQHLRAQGIQAEPGRDQTAVYVPAGMEAEAAAEAIIGGVAPQDEGLGWDVFEAQQIGMSRQQFRMYVTRALETQLARRLKAAEGFREVYVNLAIPENAYLFDEDRPTASVMVDTSRSLTPSQVRGIQGVVAMAISGMQPEDVTITDFQLTPLSEMTEVTATSETEARLQFTTQWESMIAARIIQQVAPVVGGPQNIRANVTLLPDWQRIEEDITNNVDPVPEKKTTTTVVTREIEEGQEPGVAANVPDAGPAETAEVRETVIHEETVSDTEFALSVQRIARMNAPGSYLKVPPRAVITVNSVLSEEGEEPVQITDEIEQEIENIVAAILPLYTPDEEETGAEPAAAEDHIVVAALPFMEIQPRAVEAGVGLFGFEGYLDLVRRYLPTVLMIVLALFALFQIRRVLSAAPVPPSIGAEEESEVTRTLSSRELSLAELGIRSPEDIAQLPPEDQRRIKLQGQLKDWAKEKPDRVARILKSWMHE